MGKFLQYLSDYFGTAAERSKHTASSEHETVIEEKHFDKQSICEHPEVGTEWEVWKPVKQTTKR